LRYNNPLSRLFNASRYSLYGLYHALIHEQAFQYESVVFVILCVVLFFVPLSIDRKIFLIFSWLAVMCLELINSAVEKAFDLIDKNYRPEIKYGKDMLSASVFLAVSFNIFLWIIFI